jgi:hypothetical protein
MPGVVHDRDDFSLQVDFALFMAVVVIDYFIVRAWRRWRQMWG